MFYTDFQSLKEKIDMNKNKDKDDWLTFKNVFEKPGKQGIVGLFDLKETEESIVFKVSQDINYLAEHEYSVMESLNDLHLYCPHFCKSLGLIECLLEPKTTKTKNPFIINSKYGIRKNVLLTEYIRDSYKFYNYIKTKNFPENILFSIIKQVLLALKIAQNKKNFTHYDLHSCNIMLKRCDEDMVFMYIIDDDIFTVPTYGYYPVIIDFGFSYIKEIENRSLLTSMGHTHAGFNSHQFDLFADPKLFLTTISDELIEERHTSTCKKFKRIILNMFDNLEIDWRSGWDNFEKRSSADYICDLLNTFTNNSRLFSDYSFYCIDLIQSLIILPFEKQDFSNLEKSYNAFIKEWEKIENSITNVYYNLYILKKMVDSARLVRSDYMNITTQKIALVRFKKDLYKVINEVAKYCNISTINFEILLCSLYVLSKCIEGILYNTCQDTNRKKQIQYDKLPIKSLEEIFSIIDTNIQSDYIFNKKTKILILNSNTENTSIHIPDEQERKNMNGVCNILKGWELLKTNSDIII